MYSHYVAHGSAIALNKATKQPRTEVPSLRRIMEGSGGDGAEHSPFRFANSCSSMRFLFHVCWREASVLSCVCIFHDL